MEKLLGNFVVPKCLLAAYPVSPRDGSRLLVVHQKNKTLEDIIFYQLSSFLQEGDLLILNNTKVFSARVFLKREKTGGRHECIFLKKDLDQSNLWEVVINKSNRLLDGEHFTTLDNKKINFIFRRLDKNQLRLEEACTLNLEDFNAFGNIPIPPYLGRCATQSDQKNYQSIFAKKYGSAASPTASLHFTEKLLTEIKQKKINFEEITLHIGYGTFAPLTETNFTERKLHSEFYMIPAHIAETLKNKNYSRLIVVGTTTLRALETVHRKTQGQFNHSLSGETDLFLFPPDQIHTADLLITNFHLPESSLMYLVSCMVPMPFLKKVYEHAVKSKYRFFSYGDAMLVC